MPARARTPVETAVRSIPPIEPRPLLCHSSSGLFGTTWTPGTTFTWIGGNRARAAPVEGAVGIVNPLRESVKETYA